MAIIENNPIRVAEILLVEDSPTDALLTKEALSNSKLLNRLHLVKDGNQALAFLSRQAPYEAVPRPDLILLDLNLPGISGIEVLQKIKADPSLSLIPVVILTTSTSDQDIIGAYSEHASCYISKPVDLASFTEVIRRAGEFWFAIVTLPPQ
ncbi:MAG: hypothetical protein RL468_1853 [Pseudomonadota bacterium]|jgi:CheY-like chemotaxis protein